MPCPDHPGHHIRCVVCEADNIAAADAARADPRDARIAELEVALREAVEELTTCERMLSGETYNNPKFNRLLGISAETPTE